MPKLHKRRYAEQAKHPVEDKATSSARAKTARSQDDLLKSFSILLERMSHFSSLPLSSLGIARGTKLGAMFGLIFLIVLLAVGVPYVRAVAH